VVVVLPCLAWSLVPGSWHRNLPSCHLASEMRRPGSTAAPTCGPSPPLPAVVVRRDYGLYDGAQLRFPGAQMLGPNLYRRR
jgi:hypothetical protein